MALKEKIGFIGGGAMGEALLTGIIDSGLSLPENLYVSDTNEERLTQLKNKLNINTLKNNIELVQNVDIVVLAVKPFVLAGVLEEINSIFQSNQLIVSIAAGIPTEYIEGHLPGVPVIRVMPNTPSLLGEGAIAVAQGKNALTEHREKVEQICSSAGIVVPVKESLMDGVTGVSGSGPAYMYLVIEAMADAGVKMGLPRDTALKLGAQTMLGAARMVLETGEHPARLKDKVTTPGGTTIKGVFELEDANVRAAFMKAVEASCLRSKELSTQKD